MLPETSTASTSSTSTLSAFAVAAPHPVKSPINAPAMSLRNAILRPPAALRHAAGRPYQRRPGGESRRREENITNTHTLLRMIGASQSHDAEVLELPRVFSVEIFRKQATAALERRPVAIDAEHFAKIRRADLQHPAVIELLRLDDAGARV